MHSGTVQPDGASATERTERADAAELQPSLPSRRASLFASVRKLTLSPTADADAHAPSLLSRTSQLFTRRTRLFASSQPSTDPTPLLHLISPPARYAHDVHGALHRASSTLQTRASWFGAAPVCARTTSADVNLHEWYQLIRLPQLNTVVRNGDRNAFGAPAFKLIAYGHNSSSCDALILYTNALRAESRTLFFLLFCLHERSQLLESGDLMSFFVWYQPYAHFVHSVITLFQHLWLPRLERCSAFPSAAAQQFFTHASSRLDRTVLKLLSHQTRFIQCPRVAAKKLRELFCPYAQLLLDYCAKLEKLSNSFIRSNFSHEETVLLAKQFIAEFKRMPHFNTNLVLLLRWLSNRPETASYWRRDHLDGLTAMRYTQWKKDGKQQEVVSYFANKTKAHPYNRYFVDRTLPSF